VLLLLGLAAPAAAQQPDTTRDVRVDVSRLPINLRRIERELRSMAIREERDGLNLRYQVEVFGRLPAVTFFTPEDNLAVGPVPYGGPTHRDMIEHVTPQEFRSPVMDFGSLFKWLGAKVK
jgi:hypothetical protein